MIYKTLLNSKLKILIEDSIKDDDLLVSYLILNNEIKSIEISFVNIDFISKKVFIALIKIKNNSKIFLNSKSLSKYFTKIGLHHVFNNTEGEYDVKKEEGIQAIVLAGSAGSNKKIIQTITNLPTANIAIFVVVHLLSNKKSLLEEILKGKTEYKIIDATNKLKIQNKTIYISPSHLHMIIVDGYIYLTDSKEVNYSKPSISLTFTSLSLEYKNTLLAILFSGYGNDGSDSTIDLKNNNSSLLIEDPNFCNENEMLINAINTNNDTSIFILDKLDDMIKKYLNISDNEEEYKKLKTFFDNIYKYYNYDFRNYNKKFLLRRVKLFITLHEITCIDTLEKELYKNKFLFKEFIDYIFINVTEFFRNPLVFKNLKKEVIPYLASFTSIKIWSAACSKGNEAYSLAMLFDEMGLLHKTQIYATDIDTASLEEARNGIFSIEEYESLRKNYNKTKGSKDLAQWINVHEDYIEIKDKIRDKVLFFNHNLVSDSTINEFNLIFCRNVLIYFNKKLQKDVFDTIDSSLCEDGFLVLGESEVLFKEYNYKIVGNKKDNIFQKELL